MIFNMILKYSPTIYQLTFVLANTMDIIIANVDNFN